MRSVWRWDKHSSFMMFCDFLIQLGILDRDQYKKHLYIESNPLISNSRLFIDEFEE